MGKYISLGKYNKLYKYIWIYLSIRFITMFVFDGQFVFEQIRVNIIEIPYSPFIFRQINYSGLFIISSIIKLIKKFSKKKVFIRTESTDEDSSSFNEIDKSTKFGIKLSDYFLYVNLFFLILVESIRGIMNIFQFYILEYWMFLFLFLELFYSRLFKSKIYKHHILS